MPSFRAVFFSLLICQSLLLVSGSSPTRAQKPLSAPQNLTFSDIAYVYHGAAVDKDFRVIILNHGEIEQVLSSMITTLSKSRPALKLPDGTLRPAIAPVIDPASTDASLKFFESGAGDPLFAKIAYLRQAVERLSPSERVVYVERLTVLRQILSRQPGVALPKAGSQTWKVLSLRPTKATIAQAGDLASYVAECKAGGVPIPPNWPNVAWTDRGALPPASTFASFPGTVSSQVFTYEPADASGLCYALPRKSGAGSIEAMGVICQSKQTGKACFFDNLDSAGDRITGNTIAVDFSLVQNGYVLEENCTTCHRGGNVFMVHPKTPLGAVRGRNPLTRYSPIGQAAWSNPPATSEQGDGACAECHEIAAANPAYCSFLKKASNLTMPQPDAVAGWESPTSDYKAHIDFLKGRCP